MDIFQATRRNQIDGLILALKTTDPDICDSRGSTPLILAGYYNHKEVTAILLNAKANPNLHDYLGNTALMGACFMGYIEIAEMLLDAGALVDKQNDNLATALSFATNFGNVKIVELLLTNGANPLLKDKFGNNPIDYAIIQENEDCYKLLVSVANSMLAPVKQIDHYSNLLIKNRHLPNRKGYLVVDKQHVQSVENRN